MLTRSVSMPLRDICPIQLGRLSRQILLSLEDSQLLLVVTRIECTMVLVRGEGGAGGGDRSLCVCVRACECVCTCVCVCV